MKTIEGKMPPLENARSPSRIAGFDHYLTKPLDFEQLESLLQKADQER